MEDKQAKKHGLVADEVQLADEQQDCYPLVGGKTSLMQLEKAHVLGSDEVISRGNNITSNPKRCVILVETPE